MSGFIVPLLQDNTPANSETFNTPLSYIQTALNTLLNRLATIQSRDAIVRTNIPTTASVGDLVYYNVASGKFEPAQALIDSSTGYDGNPVLSSKAFVVGLVVEKPTLSTGTLWTGGFFESQSAADACLGLSALPGTYYLSSTTAGKATLTQQGPVSQPVLLYLGEGRMTFSLFHQPVTSHQHRSLTLSGSWIAAAEITDHEVPSGGTFRYDGENDAQFSALGGLLPGSTVIFEDGVMADDFIVLPDAIWYTGEIAPAGTVVVVNHFPSAFESPALRGIVSAADRIILNNRNGVVTIRMDALITGAPAYSRYAVSGMTSRTASMTPVVSHIVGSNGISVSIDSRGVALVGLSGYVSNLLDADRVNLNGVAQVTQGIYTVYQFPAGRAASAVMSKPVSGISEEVSLGAATWFEVVSGGGDLLVEVYFMPDPAPGATGAIPVDDEPLHSYTLTIPATSGVVRRVECLETDRILVAGSGMLVARVSCSDLAADMRIIRMGFILHQEGGDEFVDPNMLGASSALVGTGTAGEALSAFHVVLTDAGSLFAVDPTEASHANRAIGITMTGAEIGEQVDYMSSGTLQGAFDLTPGEAIFVGAGGELVSAPPEGAMFVQQVGVALTAAAIQVNILDAVLPEQ